MEEEIWKDIEGYQGLYQVSNLGRVKSLSKWHKNGSNGYLTKEKILKHAVHRDNYLIIVLSKNNKQKTVKVHRLVAKAFIPNPNNLLQAIIKMKTNKTTQLKT